MVFLELRPTGLLGWLPSAAFELLVPADPTFLVTLGRLQTLSGHQAPLLLGEVFHSDNQCVLSNFSGPPQLEKNHVLPSSSQDEALCPLQHLKR